MKRTHATDARVRERELGLRRLRHITRVVAAVAAGGCAVFAGLAASKPHAAKTTTSTKNAAVTRTLAAKQAAVATTAATTTSTPAVTIAAPTTTTTVTPVAPVTSSGGS
jgi:hypothetical protein